MIKSGLPTSRSRNMFLGNGEDSGILFMWSNTSLPDLGSDDRAFGFQSATPKYWQGTSWADFSAGGGYTTWDDLYGNDKTLTIDSATLTFALTHATNDGLTVTGAAGSSGDCIQITNSGTGSDIEGTSATWSVSKAGAAVLTGITGCDTLVAAANLALDATGAGTITLAGTSTGAITLTTATTCSASLTVGTTLTVGTGATFSDGLVDIIDNSNAASGLRVTNDTVTTYGNAADAGVVVIRSESLQTGTLLHLSLDETPLNGGYFFRCWSQDLGSAALTIGEFGVTTIAGPAAGGSNAFVITAGDVSFADSSVTITDADNAVSFAVVNNTATTIGAAVSGGITALSSTSLTTGALMNLQLTEGTLTTGWYLRCWDATAAAGVFSIGEDGAVVITDTSATAIPVTVTADSATAVAGLIRLTADALTTGLGVLLESTSLALAAGQLLNIDHTCSGTISAAKTGQLVDVVSSRTHTAATAISDDYDALSIIRTSIMNNAGGTLNAAGAVLYIQNVSTQTAGTMADTANGIEVVMTGGAESQGYGLSITHTGTTVGRAIDIVASQTTGTVGLITANSLTTSGVGLSIACTGTGMTTGSLLRVSSGTTAALATNGIVSLTATGAFTSTAATDAFLMVTANSAVTATIMAVAGNALTTGVAEYIGSTGTGLTSGSLLRVVSATAGAVATNGIVSIQATGAYTSTSNVGALSVLANATTAGTVAYLSATSMTTGTILFLNATAASLTGKYIQCWDGAADDFSVGQYGATIIAGVAGSTVLTVSAGDVSFADGSVTIADNDNAATVSITNDTATSIGNGANAGIVDLSGDGLTSGTLLNLSVTEGTLNGGYYVKGWDVTGGVMTWGLAEDGELFIAGGTAVTAGGADAVNIGASAAIKILFGSGAPTATAPQGSIYLRTDGSSTSTRLYVNTDGAGTWTNVTAAA